MRILREVFSLVFWIAQQIEFYNKLKLKRNYRIKFLSYNLLTKSERAVRIRQTLLR